MPAAAVITLGGLLACFAGYRFFRLTLGIFGFIAGAFVVSSMMAPANTWTLVAAALGGGVLGGLLMVVAYFMGVGLVGAGLAALVLNIGWRLIGGEPPTIVLVVVCVVGALLALSVVRFVVIVGTALVGSWSLLVGALALAGDTSAMHAATAGDVWVFYPLDPLPARWWYTVLWVVLAGVGALVQMATTTSSGKAKKKVKSR